MLFDPNWKPQTDATPVIKRKGLTKSEIDALLWVREGLKSGQITNKQFQMDNSINVKRGCGTVGCVAGWMGMYQLVEEEGLTPRQINKRIHDAEETEAGTLPEVKKLLDKKKFESLFYMRQFYPNSRGNPPTAAQGVEAIDRFLAGEKSPWGLLPGNEEAWRGSIFV